MSRLGNELSISRALRIFARATIPALCDTSDQVGNCVYIAGDAVGSTYVVRTADPTDPEKMPVVGVLWKKRSATECRVRLFGELKGVYAGLSPGLPLYVGLDGRLTHTPPENPGGPIYAQLVGWALSSSMPFLWSGPTGAGWAETVYQRPLSGPQDGVNVSYTTPEKFLPSTIRVYRNGVRQKFGVGMDFTLEEGGGLGSGYDTVVFGGGFPPIATEALYADYAPSV
jgi:hypothetical protein